MGKRYTVVLESYEILEQSVESLARIARRIEFVAGLGTA